MQSPASCHVIYVNRKASRDRLVRANASGPVSDDDDDGTRDEVQALLEAFGDVQVCKSGSACLATVFELYDRSMIDMRPTIVLIDTPHDDFVPDGHPDRSSRSPSPSSRRPTSADIHTPDEEAYGLGLLRRLIMEARLRNTSKLVVPVPIISHPAAPHRNSVAGQQTTDGTADHGARTTGLAANRGIIRKCLDVGAADVIISPLSQKCIATLEICAYRAHRDAVKEHQELLEIKRGRQRSWVGVNEEKPFAYLREAMVSGLMKGICRLGPEDDRSNKVHIAVSADRQTEIADAVGRWHFSAHAFTDDELVVASMVMFRHTLSMPELERWRIPTDQLINFLVACRAAYNNFVPYHNFRHVVDVLQATFNFLVHIGSVAPYPGPLGASAAPASSKSPIGSLIEPFEALTLLVTAIGHDVGHPGVNNGFLVTLNAPLAQLYNDRSVLESFHCAAYSQILRRYWPAAFEDAKMRKLMISSILATDMGLHFDYMKKLGDTQEKLQVNNSTEGWNGRQIEEQKVLACCLLIKCADISNVARRQDAAVQWMHILSEEFSRQASMEGELQIPSSLMAPPKKDMASLAKAQLGFMNLFAIPLFQGVADIMPGMGYTVEELEINKDLFERVVEEEKLKELRGGMTPKQLLKEGTFSPRTMSFAVETGGNGDNPTTQDNDKPERVTSGPPKDLAQTARPETTEVPRAGTATATATASGAAPGGAPSDASTSRAGKPPTLTDGVAAAGGCGSRDTNGRISSFDAVMQLANSDPFNVHGHGGLVKADDGAGDAREQRCSETTTEGSTSVGLTGDWASQATSTKTGRMPISPSTQGTSIVSKESAERPTSEPTPNGKLRPAQAQASPARYDGNDEEYDAPTPVGSIGKAEGKSLRKKSSRFRMRDLPFFRRTKGSCP